MRTGPRGLTERARCPVCRKTFATFIPSGGGEPRCLPHNRVLDGAAGDCWGGGKFAPPAQPLEDT